MKLNHKFRLIPADEETINIDSFESEMKTLRENKKIPDYKKLQLYEDLIARLRNYRDSINKPPVVAIAEKPEIVIPDYKLPKQFEDLWVRFPEIRSTATDELVLNGEVIPNTNINAILDHALLKKKSKKVPNGFTVVDNFLKSHNINIENITRDSKKKSLPDPQTTSAVANPDALIEASDPPKLGAPLETPRKSKRAAKPAKKFSPQIPKKISRIRPETPKHSRAISKQISRIRAEIANDTPEEFFTPTAQKGRGRKQRFYIRLWK